MQARPVPALFCDLVHCLGHSLVGESDCNPVRLIPSSLLLFHSGLLGRTWMGVCYVTDIPGEASPLACLATNGLASDLRQDSEDLLAAAEMAHTTATS